MLREIEIGVGIVLRIPDAWDRFVYRGWLYVRDEFGHYVVMGLDGSPGPPGTAGLRAQ